MTARVHVTSPGAVESETGSLMYPRVLSDNLARRPGVVISASSEAPGWPARAALSDNTYERWRANVSAQFHWWILDIGTAQPCNACAVAAHNLFSTGARSFVIGSSDDGTNWHSAVGSTPIHSDAPLLFLFAQQVRRYWRLSMHSTDGVGLWTPTIGHIRFGRALTLQHGIAGPYVPLDYARRVVVSPSRSEGGQWLGASVRRTGQRSDVQISGLTWDWWRTHGDPFVREARDRARPFFFAWSPARAPQDVAYCTLDADVEPAHRAGDLVDVTLSLSGFAGP